MRNIGFRQIGNPEKPTGTEGGNAMGSVNPSGRPGRTRSRHVATGQVPKRGIITLDRDKRVFSLDDPSSALVDWPDALVGNDWRRMFDGEAPPELEFAVMHDGDHRKVDICVLGRRMRFNIFESAGHTILVWEQQAADRGDLKRSTARPFDPLTCYFSVCVAPDNGFIFDIFDEACETASGRPYGSFRGWRPHELLPEPVADRLTAHYAECVKAKGPIQYDNEISLKSGTRQFRTTLIPVRDARSGRVCRLVGRAREIAARVSASPNGTIETTSLQAMIDPLPTQIMILASDGTVRAVNPAWNDNAIFPMRCGQNFLTECCNRSRVLPLAAEIAIRLRELIHDKRDTLRIGYRQSQGMIELRGTTFDVEGERLLLLTRQDVTSSRRKADVTVGLPEVLRAVRDDERQIISRDLHDSTAQALVGASLALERLLHTRGTSASQLSAELRQVQDLIQQSLTEIRTFSYLLLPLSPNGVDLASTLTWFVSGVARRGGLSIHLSVDEELVGHSSGVAIDTALLRVAQEAIGNAYRHSHGSRIDVHLESVIDLGREALALSVIDDGVGASDDVLHAFTGQNVGGDVLGVGLSAMRGRVTELGGHLTLTRGRQGGTCLRAVVPLRAEPVARDKAVVARLSRARQVNLDAKAQRSAIS
jgi:signal transduction histidine kinase